MKLSVVIPCYNEQATIAELLERVRAAEFDKQIIVVDDGSTDGTREILRQQAARGDIETHFREKNGGKGAAVQDGLRRATGEIILIQDADLEYDPADYPSLIRPIVTGKAKVVYGSRFIGEHKAMYFWHAIGNQSLTLLTNMLFDTTLTDMETCYKVFTRDIAARLRLREPRWGFDPEITAKILKGGDRIYEVPISYAGREYWEGKKITWRDGLRVLWVLIRCRFFE
ncbi:MAG: glycosyltransferase family 2 protein [Chloroflexi bacterium]|nr:glycosyltransferase family 2 protein [Chloroflexota bacterium]